MENLQAYIGDSPSVNELMTPDPRIQGGACRTLVIKDWRPSTFLGRTSSKFPGLRLPYGPARAGPPVIGVSVFVLYRSLGSLLLFLFLGGGGGLRESAGSGRLPFHQWMCLLLATRLLFLGVPY